MRSTPATARSRRSRSDRARSRPVPFELIKPDTNFDFVGQAKYAIALSLAILRSPWPRCPLRDPAVRLGIDFTGGTEMQLRFAQGARGRRGARSARCSRGFELEGADVVRLGEKASAGDVPAAPRTGESAGDAERAASTSCSDGASRARARRRRGRARRVRRPEGRRGAAPRRHPLARGREPAAAGLHRLPLHADLRAGRDRRAGPRRRGDLRRCS